MRFKWNQEFEILKEGENRSIVTGAVWDIFGIDNRDRGLWVITHLPTGMLIGKGNSFREARDRLNNVLEISKGIGIDWNLETVDKFREQTKFSEVSDSLRSYLVEGKENSLLDLKSLIN